MTSHGSHITLECEGGVRNLHKPNQYNAHGSGSKLYRWKVIVV